jgi:hypothetical protein
MPLAKATQAPPTPADTGLLHRWWAAWRERRYVSRRCHELLALSQTLRQSDPQMTGIGLYRRIVQATLGGDAEKVEQVLRQAEENFATWPVTRALSLRDVVHHLAVVEYFRLHAGTHQMRADDLKRLVDETIPGDL